MAAYKPIRIGDSVPLQQISPSTETIDGKIQVTQTGVVLGRSSAGAGAHEEILFADLPGGGGASYTEITYADMATALTGGTLTPGGWYLITDAAGTDLGFLTNAVNENTINVSGVGGYLNADFQAVGDYTGVEAITGQAAGTQQGIWRTSFEAVTINYLNLAGGTFAVGDTITGGTTFATAVIITDDGVSSMTAYMTSAGLAFDGSEVLDNGNSVTADMDGAASAPTIAQGDIVIWNLLHWQLTDIGSIAGTNPAANVAAYTQLLKTDADQGYIEAWDVSEFDFQGNTITYRKDLRDNVVYQDISVITFPFGNNKVRENFLLGGQISGNCTGQIRKNILYQDASIFTNGLGDVTECILYANSQIGVTVSEDSVVTGCTLYPSSNITETTIGNNSVIEYNILENGAQLTGITAGANCSISRNKIGQGATLGGSTTMGDGAAINDNQLNSSALITINTLGDGATISNNTLSTQAAIINCSIGASSNINGCNLYRLAYFSNATIGDSTAINACILGNGALMYFNDFGNGGSFDGNEIGQAIEFSNITFSPSFAHNNNKHLAASINIAHTFTTDYSGKQRTAGFSNFDKQIDITGLTTLDCLAENNYVGIFNLTSTNATEAIDTISNPPTLFPFTLRPAAGLVLTITGTAYADIAAGQIALRSASYTLDGDKGEYIVLEIDPLGTGALIEKAIVNGLI